jgi:hypothetical protein
VIAQISTYTKSLYAAVVLVPATVKDPDIRGSGDGADPAVALYTAQAGSDFANGQMIACTLAPAEDTICAASLRFFLATDQHPDHRGQPDPDAGRPVLVPGRTPPRLAS